MGFDVAEDTWPETSMSADDIVLMSSNLDSHIPWLPWASLQPVPARHILAAAVGLDVPHRRVVERLLELGFEVDCVRLSAEPVRRPDAPRRKRSSSSKPAADVR